MNEVVKQVDASISVNTVWEFVRDQNYVFRGKDGSEEYLVNLFTGMVLKNGSESNQLPIKVRRHSIVDTIFGSSSDMEIFVMKSGAVRTRISFAENFLQERETEVFF